MKSRILVLPSRSLRDLIIRAVRRRRVPYNYAVAYRDTRGFGLSIAVVDWLPSGQTYVNTGSN